jgi:hypothetical protein
VIYVRDGVELSRSALADWVGQCSALLRPHIKVVRRYVMAASKIHADDTPVPVLEQKANQYAYTICDGDAVPPRRDDEVFDEKPANILSGTLEDDARVEARRRTVPPSLAEAAFRWAL